MVSDVLFSSKKQDWATPWNLFNRLDEEFHFTCDVAASHANTKVPENYLTESDDALSRNWRGVCYCNPPYGRMVGAWILKASMEAASGRATTVMLLPARVDTGWFHAHIWPYRQVEVRFLKGRVKFEGAKSAAPFPSMVVIFRAATSTSIARKILGDENA